MSILTERNPAASPSSMQPMLRINRLNYVKLSTKILDGTGEKLTQYVQFAGEQMGTEVTHNDVIEYALNMLFDRDSGFKSWLKRSGRG